MSSKKEIKATFYILLLLVVATVIFIGFSSGMDYMNKSKMGWIITICYFLFVLLAIGLESMFSSKFTKAIIGWTMVPFGLIYLLLSVTIPFIALLLHATFFLLICSILPTVFFIINDHFHFFPITQGIRVFTILTFGSICSTGTYSYIMQCVRGIFTQLFDKLKHDELINYVFTLQNIKFMIYGSYLVCIIVYSFDTLQFKSAVGEVEKAVYQSFACFLAFDRVMQNSNQFKLLPSAMLKMILDFLNSSEKNKEEKKYPKFP